MKAKYTRDSISPEMYEALKTEALKIAAEEYEKIQLKQIKWMWAVTLWTLHTRRGFGRKRLQETFDWLIADYDKARDDYGVDEPVTALGKRAREEQKARRMSMGEYCMIRLQQIGIDVEKMVNIAEGALNE